MVGFEAKPAHDAIQAAALYRGRLAWFDHHEWPPEDVHAMRQAIGTPMLHVTPGTESVLAGGARALQAAQPLLGQARRPR